MNMTGGELTFFPPPRDATVQQRVHERWAVKTGGGPDANLIDASAVTLTTIASLISQPAPSAWPPAGRVKGVETTIWELDVILVGYQLEQDQDYHLVLADQAKNTMIAEIPDPALVDASSLFKAQIVSSRQAFDGHFGLQMQALRALAQPGAPAPMIVQVAVPVHVTGPGFFDFIHGQTGVAPNGIELHPVLNIQFPAP
jgi:hypothetical protein